METVKVGDKIRVINMDGKPDYNGRVGYVQNIDDAGQIHCSFGGCALIPEVDKFEILSQKL